MLVVVYSVTGQPTSVHNFLLLFAAKDGKLAVTLEMLREMQVNKNHANHACADAVFDLVARSRLQLQLELEDEHEDDQERKRTRQALEAIPTLVDLLTTYTHVFVPTEPMYFRAITHSLRNGDFKEAMQIFRIVHWRTDIVLRDAIYAQLMYPLMANDAVNGSSSKLQPKFVVEIEQCFDRHYPARRSDLYVMVLGICESENDISSVVKVLNRMQEERISLVQTAIARVFNVISKHLAEERAEREKEMQRSSWDERGDEEEEEQLHWSHGLVTYRMLLEAYTIVPKSKYFFSHAIVRSATSGIHEDAIYLTNYALEHGIPLQKNAYAIAISIWKEREEWADIIRCYEAIQETEQWKQVIEYDPQVQVSLEKAQREKQI